MSQDRNMAPERTVVEKNLDRMRSTKEGGMEFTLLRESIGGNAGCYEGIPCGGANFRYDKNTGLILYFGNIQDLPREILPISVEGTFRVPVDLIINSPVGVSAVYLDGNPSEDAEKAIRETVIKYNLESDGRIKNVTFKRT